METIRWIVSALNGRSPGLFGMALRQTTGFVESLLRLVGVDWTVPDFSTLGRRQKTLYVNIPYRGSKGPLHLLIPLGHCRAIPCRAVDSTGIKVEGEGEWHARKHGGPKRRVWRKIHLGIDEQTLEIRAVEVTVSHIGDAPILPDLPSQIPPDQEIGSVTADGAYDTRKCHDATATRGAQAFGPSLGPMAFMPSRPPRRNANPWTTATAGAVARNQALRAPKYLGQALRRRRSGYYRRRRVETKMPCVKPQGQRLMARDFDRQVAEIQVRIAVLNRYTAPGQTRHRGLRVDPSREKATPAANRFAQQSLRERRRATGAAVMWREPGHLLVQPDQHDPRLRSVAGPVCGAVVGG